MSSYSGSTASKEEISCYCRYIGWDIVVEDGDGDTSLTGIKAVCDTWIDDNNWIYQMIVMSVFCMLGLNLLITYGFKWIFSKKLTSFRYSTDRFVLISLLIFFINSWFLGVVPTLVLNWSEHDMPRSWYRKLGIIYLLYYFALLIMHPLEYVLFLIINKITKNIKIKRSVLQTELNNAVVGPELEYSHKVGRLASHMWIVFLLGPGLPLLYPLFFFHLMIF